MVRRKFRGGRALRKAIVFPNASFVRGYEPLCAIYARACADPLYPVMKESIESFTCGWHKIRANMARERYHYVSFGPGTGQKDGRVAIVDDGPGLSPHELAKATTRFWRSRRHPSETGSGLGAIAERPVTARGGTLAVRANSPRGLIVECILPLTEEVSG